MQYRHIQKFVRTSPRKLREVSHVIKSFSPEEAYEKMPYMKKRAAATLRKVVGSSIANARQSGADTTNLVFKEIQISEGPRLKRWRAGARGRAKPYVRRMSHVIIVLEEKAKKQVETKAKKADKPKAAKIKKTKKDDKKTTKKGKESKARKAKK